MSVKNNLRNDVKVESKDHQENNRNELRTLIIGAGTTGKSILLFFVKLMYYWNESADAELTDPELTDIEIDKENAKTQSINKEFSKYDFYFYLVDFLKNYHQKNYQKSHEKSHQKSHEKSDCDRESDDGQSSPFHADEFRGYTQYNILHKSEMNWLYNVLWQVVNGKIVIIDDGMTDEKVDEILSYVDDKYKVENVLCRLEFMSSQNYMKKAFCCKSDKGDESNDNDKGDKAIEKKCDDVLENLHCLENVNRVFLSPGIKMTHPLVEKFVNCSFQIEQNTENMENYESSGDVENGENVEAGETVESGESGDAGEVGDGYKCSKITQNTKREIFSNDIDLFLRVIQLQKEFFIKSKKDLQQQHSYEFLLVGVTGSNGKSTTVSLISHMFNENLIKCGNIGVGVFDALDLMNEKMYKILSEMNGVDELSPLNELDALDSFDTLKDFDANMFLGYVVEISSAQLINVSCAHLLDYGFLLNITPNHLDYHKDLNDYANMKFKILNAKNSFISSDSEINRKEIKIILRNLKIILRNLGDRDVCCDGIYRGDLHDRGMCGESAYEFESFGLFSIEDCMSFDHDFEHGDFEHGDFECVKKYCFLNGEIFLNGSRVLSLRSKKQEKKNKQCNQYKQGSEVEEAFRNEKACDDNYKDNYKSGFDDSESDELMYKNYVPEYAVLVSFILMNSIVEKFKRNNNLEHRSNIDVSHDLQNGVIHSDCKIGKMSKNLITNFIEKSFVKNFMNDFVVNFVSKLNNFVGLKYRLEKILSISCNVIYGCDADAKNSEISSLRDSNVTFFNDSKSTTVTSTIFALKHLKKMNRNARIFLILGGGDAKKQNFHELKEVEDILSDVRNKFFVIGESKNRIASALKNVSSVCNFQVCEDMYEAVNEIYDLLCGEWKKDNGNLSEGLSKGLREDVIGDNFRKMENNGGERNDRENNSGKNFSKINESFVVLSPGCESFDQYKNFNQRGEKFTEYVLSKFAMRWRDTSVKQ